MNINDIINNNGYKEVVNPSYNPNSKNNTEPRTVKVENTKYDPAFVYKMRDYEQSRGYSVDLDVVDKINKAGFNYNQREDFAMLLANSQSAFTKFKNSVEQLIVSDLALGILKGASDLVDMIGQITTLSDPNYSNPVTKKLEEWQESFRNNVAPIYTTPGVNIQNGGLLDAGWWASNIPSIISSLTLLIPSMGVTKGVSAIGKIGAVDKFTTSAVRALSGATRRTNATRAAIAAGKTAEEIALAGKAKGLERLFTPGKLSTYKLIAENGLTAATSRAIENYQEARQTYNEMYDEASKKLNKMKPEEYEEFLNSNSDILNDVDPSDRNAVAKKISKLAADKTFAMDWTNVIFDVIEMAALRGAWKGLRNAPTTPAAVRRANLDRAKYAGKSPEAIAKIKETLPFKTKFKQKVGDKLYGSKLVLFAELSEGIEEGINYIAQQEGLHLGKSIIGSLEKDDKNSTFNSRLRKYLVTPELWESAFWGVAGGVVFQYGGSKLHEWQNKLDKSDANSETTKLYLSDNQLPENKRRIAAMEATAMDMISYRTLRNKILDENIDIYHSRPGNDVKFTSDEEKEIALNKLELEYMNKMTLREMNAGNSDLFKAYLADDNVTKYLLGDNVSEEERHQHTNRLLKEVEKIEEEYDNELSRLNSITYGSVDDDKDNDNYNGTLTNKDRKQDKSNKLIPIEYLQIMASNNIKIRHNIDKINAELPAIESQIAKELHLHEDELDPGVDYENAIKMAVYVDNIRTLRALAKDIANDTDLDVLSKTAQLNTIKNQIKQIEKNLNNAELAYVTFNTIGAAFETSLDDKGNPVSKITNQHKQSIDEYFNRVTGKITLNNTETKTADDKIVSSFNFDDTFVVSDRGKQVLSPEDLGAFNVLLENGNATFNSKNITAIKNISPELSKLYKQKASIQFEIKELESELINTPKQVAEEASMLNNTIDDARRDAIDKNIKAIGNLYSNADATTRDNIKTFIANKLKNKNNSNSNLTTEQVKAINEAIEVLGLTKATNKDIINSLLKHLYDLDNIESGAEPGQNNNKPSAKNTTSTNTQSTATNQSPVRNQNANLANQNANTITTSTIEQQTQTQAKNTQIQQNTSGQPQTQTTSTNPNTNIKLNLTDKGIVYDNNVNEKEADASYTSNGDGTFTLDVNINSNAVTNSDLFINGDKIILSDDNIITKKPIVKLNNDGTIEVVEKGEVYNKQDPEYKAAQQVQQTSQEPAQQINQTPVASNNPTVAPDEAQAINSTQDPTSTFSTGSMDSETKAINETEDNTNLDNIDEYDAQYKIEEAVHKYIDENFKDYVESNSITIDSKLDKARAKLAYFNTINTQELFKTLFGIYSQRLSSNEKLLKKSINSGINMYITLLKPRLEKYIQKEENKNNESNKELNSIITELLLADDDIINYYDTLNLSNNKNDNNTPEQQARILKALSAINAYRQSMYDLIDVYTTEHNIAKINNKYYINAEELIRYIDNVTGDKFITQTLFESMKAFLFTDKDGEYVLTDKKELEKPEFLANTKKSKEIRNEEKLEVNSVMQVDVFGYPSKNPDKADTFFTAFDELQIGEQLSYRVNEKHIELLDDKGRVVGTMPIPHRNSQGSYVITNEGWNTDVRLEGNVVVSTLKNLFKSWLSEETAEGKEVSDIAMEFAYTDVSNERKAELIEKFRNNPEIKKAQSNGIIAGVDLKNDAHCMKLITHLSKLWNYAKVESNSEYAKEDISLRLNSWFKKMYNSYVTTAALANNNEHVVTVKELNSGEKILISEESKYEDMLIPSEALANGNDSNIYHIGSVKAFRTSTGVDNHVVIAGKGEIIRPAMREHGTFIEIVNGNSSEYINVFPLHVNDSAMSDTAKEIINAIKKQCHDKIENVVKTQTADSINDLFEFLKLVFDQFNGNSSLFAGSKIILNKEKHCYIFGDKNQTKHISVFFDPNTQQPTTVQIKGGNDKVANNLYGYDLTKPINKKVTDITDDFRLALNAQIDNIIDSLDIKLNDNYIAADNNKSVQLNGIAKYENGKFTIRVGNKHWTFNSFNDFIISNDLIRCNTMVNPETNTNFTRRASKGMASDMKLVINVSSKSTLPVEKKPDATSEPTPSETDAELAAKAEAAEVVDAVTQALNDDNPNLNKGLAIASILMPNNQDLLKSLEDLDLLPSNIIFDDKLNHPFKLDANGNEIVDDKGNKILNTQAANYNASSNKDTQQVKVGSVFMDKIKNPSLREQMLRKLIHEKIHLLIESKNLNMDKIHTKDPKDLTSEERLFLDIEGIYGQFIKYLSSEDAQTNSVIKFIANKYSNGVITDAINEFKKYEFNGYISQGKYKTALEEFIVEAVTSKEFALLLDSIKTNNEVKAEETSKSLLDRFIECLCKLLGIKVNDNNKSLYKDAVISLGNYFGRKSVVESNAKSKAAEVVEKIVADNADVELTPNEKYYKDNKTGKVYSRVTSVISTDLNTLIDDKGNPIDVNDLEAIANAKSNKFDPNSPYLIPSTNVGTGVDEFVRDFFLGKLDDLSSIELEEQYPNATESALDAFRTQLAKFRDDLLNGVTIPGKNITIVSRDIRANGEVNVLMPDGTTKKLNVTGTLDLLGYDQNGEFYVFDMKTLHTYNKQKITENTPKWQRQLSLYKTFLENTYGIKVNSCGIIPIKVSYENPTKTTYTVANPEKHRDYSDPTRVQLLEDGNEFRGANPELKPLEPMVTHNANDNKYSYKHLDTYAKALVFGEQLNSDREANEWVDPTEKPIEPEYDDNDATSLQDSFDEMSDDAFSSITEVGEINVDDLSPEIADIKRNAIKDGTFMKAPNGNVSNLREDQWLRVRTKAFKTWFGDWEQINAITSNLYKLDYSKVETELIEEPWKKDNTKINKKLNIYLKGNRNKGYFQLVKDQEANYYSIHFKTNNGKFGNEYEPSTKEERAILYKALVDAIPEGAYVSTWGDITAGGIYAINKLPDFDYNLTFVNLRTINNAEVPVFYKQGDVSAAIDENGEPLIAYHTVRARNGEFTNFEVFDNMYEDRNSFLYFATDYIMSASYLRDQLAEDEINGLTKTQSRLKELEEGAEGKFIKNIEYALYEDEDDNLHKAVFNKANRDFNSLKLLDKFSLPKDEHYYYSNLIDYYNYVIEREELKLKVQYQPELPKYKIINGKVVDKNAPIRAFFLNTRTPYMAINNAPVNWNTMYSPEAKYARYKYDLETSKIEKELDAVRDTIAVGIREYIKNNYNLPESFDLFSDEYTKIEYEATVKFREDNKELQDKFLNLQLELQRILNKYPILGEKHTESTRTLESKAVDNLDYDGVVSKNIYDYGDFSKYHEAGDVYAVRHPNQAKSADFNNTFDNSDDNVYHSSTTELFESSSPETFSTNMSLDAKFNFMQSLDNGEISSICN